MNLYETEALTFDPECRRRVNLQLLMCIFFFPPLFVFLFPSGSINVHGAFFWRVSVFMKNERGGKTSSCSASSISCLKPRRLQIGLDMNTLRGIRRNQGKMEKSSSCQETCWDHSASFSWTSFITCWRTLQPVLYKIFASSFLYSTNVQASHACVICRGC